MDWSSWVVVGIVLKKEKEYVDIAKARINGVITIDGWLK
jgi:hypothetical protein